MRNNFKIIKHSCPTITIKQQYKVLNYIKQLFKTKNLSENTFVKKFEKKLSKFFNLKYAICLSSGTDALHLALLSLGVDENSEVIIPAFSCSAILNAVLYLKAKPVIVDVNLEDFSISYNEIKKNISKKTKAIIVAHMFGYPAKDIKEIVNLGIPVIEDTAQSIGATIDGKLVGTFGKINVVSFYATKMITTFGEGGALLTDEESIYKFVKDVKEYDKKNLFRLRYNYKLTEIQAAMGLSQLEELLVFIRKRREIFEYYKNELKNCNKIKLFEPISKSNPVYYRFIIQLKDINIEKIIKYFKKLGIEVAKPIFIPLDKYYLGKFICKNSKFLYNTTLSLPIYPSLTKKQLKYIIKVLYNYV